MPLMTFEVSDEDKEIIGEVARERRGMTVADFIRGCIYLELVSSRDRGDRAAAQKLTGRFRRRTAKSVDLLRDPSIRSLMVK